jgi:hypothetical protein
MTLAEVFHALNQAGVRIVPTGDKLQLRPASSVTPELRDAVLQHKDELLAVLAPPPSDLDPDAAEAIAEREAIQYEGSLTGAAATAAADQAFAEFASIIAADTWDEATAKDLEGQAIDARDAVARRGDRQTWAAMSPAADNIDAAAARHDLAALRQAVADLLALDPEAQGNEPAAFPIPGIPPEAVFLYVDEDGWRWFAVDGAYVREDALNQPVCVEIGTARSDVPAPLPGAQLFYADAEGRPCPPAVAFMCTWERAPRWYYSREWPVTGQG